MNVVECLTGKGIRIGDHIKIIGFKEPGNYNLSLNIGDVVEVESMCVNPEDCNSKRRLNLGSESKSCILKEIGDNYGCICSCFYETQKIIKRK